MNEDGRAGAVAAEEEMDMIQAGSPTIELDETIDYSLVYALHTFVANLEGQVCVLKGDSLELLDDSNSYWWLVKCIKTDEIGYIPAENVETPFERLARLNKIRNVQLASINAQDAEEGDKIPPPNRRGITFSENHEIFEDYDGFDEDEDGEMEDDEAEEAVVSPTEPQVAAQSSKPREKAQSPSIGSSFLKKLLGRNSLTKKEKLNRTDAGSVKAPKSPIEKQPVAAPVPEQVAQDDGTPVKKPEPINVLRIYAGNVDLKATFKSVAITKEMNVGELLESALKRFRVPGATASEFYLSVLHLDSQERRLPESDNVFQMLDALRHKQLPGVSSRAANGAGRSVSPSVHMNDDKIIKVIINKKLNLFEKNYHLIRIFMQDESDTSGKIRTYKTIGVNSNARIVDIIEIALKKFKLPPDPNISYTLCSVFKGSEIPRNPTECVLDVLMMAEGSPEDIDFILKKEWNGEGSMPRAAPVADSQLGPAPFNPNAAKPSFLDELPMSPSQGSFVSPGENPVAAAQQAQAKDLRVTVTSPLAKEYRMSNDNVPAVQDRAPGHVEPERGQAPEAPGAVQQAGPRVGSNNSWSPPSPPDELENDRSKVASYISDSDQNQAPVQAQAQALGMQNGRPARSSSMDDKAGSVYWTGPPGVVPPRKGSLTDASIPRRLLAEYSTSEPDIKETTDKELPQPELSNIVTSQDRSSLTNQSQDGESKSSPSQFAANAAIKANFEYMEEYLEEIMKDNIDSTKLEALEQALRKNSIEPSRSRQGSVAGLSELGQYTDSGLSQILRSQRSHPELRRPSTDAGVMSGGSSPPAPRNRSNSSNPVQTTRLRDMYDDIEKDLERSLSVSSVPAERYGDEGFVGGWGSASGSPNGMGRERITRSESNLVGVNRPSIPSIVTDAAGARGIGKRSESDSAIATPVSGKVDPNDPASVIEKFRETEIMLNAMQRDLDSLLASAVNAFHVTDTVYAQ
ncbi:hypothetical protein HDU96_003588 [Phlyctochytrium bullatum]|nr:hypothetical protein HDU96_003588 [Phlyctochytrium bullatum]